MAKKIAPVPKGYRSVTPQLVVRGAAAAIEFYTDVFGADVVKLVHADDGITVLHGEIKIGNALVRVCDEMPAFGMLSPTALGGTPVGQHVYDADADGIWDRALAAGAVVTVPFADTYWGERFGRFVDPFGHVWSVARRIESLKPAEIAERARVAAEIAAQPLSIVDVDVFVADDAAVAEELVDAEPIGSADAEIVDAVA